MEREWAGRECSGITAAAVLAATRVLMAVERRGPAVQRLVTAFADPAAPTADEMHAATGALAGRLPPAAVGAGRAARAATDSRRKSADAERAEYRLDAARGELARAAADRSAEVADQNATADRAGPDSGRWVAAVQALAPAKDAVLAAARTAGAARKNAAAVTARHPGLAGLVADLDDQPPAGG